MIIDHSLGLVFLHVPKCAGTALRNAWQDAADGRDVVSFFDFGFDPVLQRQVDLAHRDVAHLVRHKSLQIPTSLSRVFFNTPKSCEIVKQYIYSLSFEERKRSQPKILVAPVCLSPKTWP